MKDSISNLLKRKENIYYDYLSFKLTDVKIIDYVYEYLKEKQIDLFIIINKNSKTKIYIQTSGKKEIVKFNLKKLHNFLRINYNIPFSYKKVSKHSVFFEAKNIILKNAYDFKPITNNHNEIKEFMGMFYSNKEIYCFNIKNNSLFNTNLF